MSEPTPARSLRIGRLALLAPLLALALDAGLGVLRSGSAQARELFVLATAVGTIALLCTPPWRATLERVVAALLERLGVLASAGLAALFGLLATGPAAAFLLGTAVAFALLAVAAAVAERARDARRARSRLVVLCVWAASFALLDAAIRVFVLPRRSHDKIFTQHDPVLGWRLRPDLSLAREIGGAPRHESTNSLGFRTPERPFDKPPGVQRVLILGDSHSEGYTVDDGKTVARLLDEALGPQVEVVSLGVGGYSTDQELLSYLEVGRRFHPDVVLLQFCGNDPPFNVQDRYWRGSKPRFVRYGDLLVLNGVPVPDTKSSGLVPDVLAEHTGLFAFLETQLRQVGLRHAVAAETDVEEFWRVTELLVRDLRRAVEGDGARLWCYDVDANDAATDGRLRALLQRQGVTYADISPAYAEDFDGLWVSGHWNEEGQRRVADALLPALRQALAPAAAPSPH
jgi:hypothetical protein